MVRPNIPANAEAATGWTNHQAWLHSPQSPTTAPSVTGIGAPSVNSSGTASEVQTDPAFLTIILRADSLSIKVRASASSQSIFFTDWPKSARGAKSVPAMIAYKESPAPILWGFEALGDSKRVGGLKGLIETNSPESELTNAGGRTSSQVMGNFLDCAVKYVLAFSGFNKALCQYTFVVPTHWDDRQLGTYEKAIRFAIEDPKTVSFIKSIEAGAMGLIRNLRRGSYRTGIILITSEEEASEIRRIDYSASDGSNTLVQLKGSTVYGCDWSDLSGAMKSLHMNPAGRAVIAMEGPGAALARILQESRKFPLKIARNVMQITSEDAVQSADQCLNETGQSFEPTTFQRLLLKNYGLRTRVPFNNAFHDPRYMKKDYNNAEYCDDLIWWMAYKDESLDELFDNPRKKKLRRELLIHDDAAKPNEYLYTSAADPTFLKSAIWYKDSPGITDLRCMEEPDLSFLESTVVTGEKTGKTVRQVYFELSLTFKANAVLIFKLTAVGGDEGPTVETHYDAT